METQIPFGDATLNATVVAADDAKACFLFLSGGGLGIGRGRYREWQDELARTGVSSISFDYSGVNGSGALLEESSLKSRIEEAAHVADWMKEHTPARRYVLYGASMGGYIALGLTQGRPGLFNALVLHAPAAYAPAAHDLRFGKEFTDKIREEESWSDSPSFDWLRAYQNPVLLIEAERDEVIPSGIIERYKSAKDDGKLSVLLLKDTPHGVWGDSKEEKNARDDIYRAFERLARP